MRLGTITQRVLGGLAAALEAGADFDTWRTQTLTGWKAAGEGEPWAEDDPALPRLETAGIAGVLARWRTLRDATLRTCGLPTRKGYMLALGKAPAAGFVFDPATMLAQILALGDEFTRGTTTAQGPLTRAVWQTWVRGWANAASELDTSAAVDDTLTSVRVALQHRGFELVRDGTARELRDKILAELAAGVLDGLDPITVAEHLRAKFGRSEYNWERLTRSEMAMAQVDGKLQHYRTEGITQVDYVTARDERVSTICRTLEAQNPYPIERAPVPVRDSHPNCRCTVRAHAD